MQKDVDVKAVKENFRKRFDEISRRNEEEEAACVTETGIGGAGYKVAE